MNYYSGCSVCARVCVPVLSLVLSENHVIRTGGSHKDDGGNVVETLANTGIHYFCIEQKMFKSCKTNNQTIRYFSTEKTKDTKSLTNKFFVIHVHS